MMRVGCRDQGIYTTSKAEGCLCLVRSSVACVCVCTCVCVLMTEPIHAHVAVVAKAATCLLCRCERMRAPQCRCTAPHCTAPPSPLPPTWEQVAWAREARCASKTHPHTPHAPHAPHARHHGEAVIVSPNDVGGHVGHARDRWAPRHGHRAGHHAPLTRTPGRGLPFLTGALAKLRGDEGVSGEPKVLVHSWLG